MVVVIGIDECRKALGTRHGPVLLEPFMANADAVDISPRRRIDERELIRGDSDDWSVLVVKFLDSHLEIPT